MLKSRVFVSMLLGSIILLGAGGATSQDYPNKPIHVLTSAAGGASDILARLIGQAISGPLGQPVVVDNGVAIRSVETAAKSPPDGYTLLFYGTLIWQAQFFQKEVNWDPIRDFSPISLVTSEPNLLLVHPTLPVKSVKDLIGLAKSKPGQLNYMSSGTGAASHIAAEVFKSMAGVNIVRIPFKSLVSGLSEQTTGEIQISFPAVGPGTPYVKAGKLKALAVTSAKPSPLVPGLPTVSATGLPGYEVVSLNGILAPAKTPAAIIKRLNEEISRVLSRAEVKEKFAATGQDIVGSSPEAFAAAIKADMEKISKLVKDAGIRPE